MIAKVPYQSLFRPTGLAELALIFDSGMKQFPPRLPEQPIFYPVLNEQYAVQIAKEWNAPSPPRFAGYVTRFDVDSSYLQKFPIKNVGAQVHEELWVPAEELNTFNSNIIGEIEVTTAFFGKEFQGFVPEKFNLARKNAIEQMISLAATIEYSGMDFICETAVNAKSVFLNYPFWTATNFESVGVSEATKKKVLSGIEKLWSERFPSTKLCTGLAV